MCSAWLIRGATVEDAAIIAHHRLAMFRDMGEVPSEDAGNRLRQASEKAIAAALAEGSYLGWLASDAAECVIAGAGVHIKPHLPRIVPGAHEIAVGAVPLVVNVYGCGSFGRHDSCCQKLFRVVT
jgi:hypothetical protein